MCPWKQGGLYDLVLLGNGEKIKRGHRTADDFGGLNYKKHRER